jgi:hypothetical protein
MVEWLLASVTGTLASPTRAHELRSKVAPPGDAAPAEGGDNSGFRWLFDNLVATASSST